jgi:hypothetical protein
MLLAMLFCEKRFKYSLFNERCSYFHVTYQKIKIKLFHHKLNHPSLNFNGCFYMTHSIHGKYLHYKGKEYEVIGLAKHSETLEELVVYKTLYGSYDLWVRPKDMFLGSVEIEGEIIPRFQKIASSV